MMRLPEQGHRVHLQDGQLKAEKGEFLVPDRTGKPHPSSHTVTTWLSRATDARPWGLVPSSDTQGNQASEGVEGPAQGSTSWYSCDPTPGAVGEVQEKSPTRFAFPHGGLS